MARSWLINSRGLAKKVKNATTSAAQIKDCGAYWECPNCHYHIDNNDVSPEWPGLPIGVKFDPSDAELLEHLAAKHELGNSKAHMFIDEFIPTLESDEGICYTHPENLPGVRKDGSSVHFFYRNVKAYASGQRKRRKIHDDRGREMDHVRWHKTGKTKRVMENGVQKGCKKVLVLYGTSTKRSKPHKTNWVMHQYHLGMDEDEKDGEYVVSKIFCQQQKQTEKIDTSLVIEESDIGTSNAGPRTPKIATPHPPRSGKTPCSEDMINDYGSELSDQEMELIKEASHPCPSLKVKDEMEDPAAWLVGESQSLGAPDMDGSLLCNEILDPLGSFGVIEPNNALPGEDAPKRDGSSTSGLVDLENLELDTPPEIQFTDFQFGSQDSLFSWLDRL